MICVLNETPVVNIGGRGGVAAFSFAAGFSEAAFLGLLARILDSGPPRPANAQSVTAAAG